MLEKVYGKKSEGEEMGKIREEKYYIWGTGYQVTWMHQYYSGVLQKLRIEGYIDNDPEKWGKQFKGRIVYKPDVLKENSDYYLIVPQTYVSEVRKQIERDYKQYSQRIVEDNFLEKVQMIMRYETCQDREISEILDYLETNPLQVFNYSFVEKYNTADYVIQFDLEKGLYFTLHKGKKMYFSRSFTSKESVAEYYRSICLEQDEESPHKYLTETFDVPDDAVVVDAGVAEGNFSLEIVDRVKKIYLFEPDALWVEALQHTFAPYREKVEIINKCLSNYMDEDTTTIDETLKGEKIDFIKMDIEGEEYYALEGAKKSLNCSPEVKSVICTYHQEFAYEALKGLLEKEQFMVNHSKGYMWYPDRYNIMRAPVLRRGLIRAEKERVK